MINYEALPSSPDTFYNVTKELSRKISDTYSVIRNKIEAIPGYKAAEKKIVPPDSKGDIIADEVIRKFSQGDYEYEVIDAGYHNGDIRAYSIFRSFKGLTEMFRFRLVFGVWQITGENAVYKIVKGQRYYGTKSKIEYNTDAVVQKALEFARTV